jgi:glycosyltransferase involved in cell wall biosynthesis
LVVHSLTEELVKRGHDVTLFASGNNDTRAKLVSIADISSYESGDLDVHLDFENVLISKAYSIAKNGNFDIIHSHCDISTAYYAPLVDTPTVSTLHCPIGYWYDKRIIEYFKDTQWYVSISNERRKDMSNLNYISTVDNGINVDDMPFSEKKDNYVMVVGRIVKEKGIDVAIRAASLAKVQLYIFGPVDNTSEYWKNEIEPYVDGVLVKYMGIVAQEEVFKYMSKALAVLMPIKWQEPFGLVVAEAMAAGTPSIAFPHGSMNELITNGKIGYIVEFEAKMSNAINNIHKINPQDCRKEAQKRFSITAMADGYEKAYKTVISLANQK